MLKAGCSSKTGTMAYGQFFYLPLLQDLYRLIQLLAIAETQMSPANYRVDVTPACLLCSMLKRIDQSGMATTQQDYQPFVRGDNKGLVVIKRVTAAATGIRIKPAVTGLKACGTRNLAGHENVWQNFSKLVGQVKVSPLTFQIIPWIWHSQREGLASILVTVAGIKNGGMPKNPLGATGSQQR